ncbi:helix-hairpin-helix domain-containing protein [bacterium]|nr:helix-hairpin-helix domain-containing protein [bacterium]
MAKQACAIFFLLALIVFPAASPALYQGEYALIVEGPAEVLLESTEDFTATAYDPAGAVIGTVTFQRTFNTLGLVTVRRQMTITKPDGTKLTLYGTLDVMVKTGGTGGTEAAAPEGAYFTNPSQSSSTVQNVTVDFIRSAQSEILLAAYTIESQEVADALIEAAGRLGPGKVKVVVEEKYYSDPKNAALYNSLEAAGVQIVSDGTASGALMHNKFVVVDNEAVLSGSTNFTAKQLTQDANNSLIFRSSDLADAYATEFNEMFGGTFDGAKTDNTPHNFTVEMGGDPGKMNINTASEGELASLPGIGSTTAQAIVSYRETNGPFGSVEELDNVSGIGPATVQKVSPYVSTSATRSVPVEAYFTPSDQVKEKLIEVINNATTSISFSIFTFTDPDIAAALSAAKARGVTVQGVFDAWQANSPYSQFDDLQAAGLDVKEDGFTSLNHSKYLVADGSTVVTGSFNWTGSASGENDENLLIIKDATISSQYLGNFNLAYASAE